MCQIIWWFNENEGFLSFLLSICTILLSLKIAKMPYKKKIIGTIWLDGKAEQNCFKGNASVTNVGRIPVHIKSIEVTDKKRKVIESFMINTNVGQNCTTLMPGENVMVYGSFKNNVFEKHYLDLNGHIKLKITEIDGKKHYVSKGFAVG